MKLKLSNFLLMGSHLPKSRFELIRVSAGLVAMSVIFFYLAVNAYLSRNEAKITESIKEYFSEEVQFGDVSFELPNVLVIQGFKWGNGPRQQALLEVEKAKAYLSWPAVINNPRKSIRELTFIRPRIRGQSTLLKITKEIHYILKNIKPSNNGFVFKAVDIEYPFKDYETGRPVSGDMRLLYKNGQMDIAAGMNTKNPLQLSLRSVKKGKEFDLNFIEAVSADMNARFWGKWHMHDIDLKGHVFVHQGRYGRHSLVDVESSFKAFPDKLVMNSLSFLLDGVPVNMNGELELDLPQNFRMGLKYSPQLASVKQHAVKDIILSITGIKNEKFLVADGQADIAVSTVRMFETDVSNVRFTFNQLEADLNNPESLALSLAKTEFLIPDKDQRLVIEDIDMDIIRKEGQPQLVRYSFPFYSGSVNGMTTVNQKFRPAAVSSAVNMYDVNLVDIGKFLYDFRRSQGRLQAAVDVNCYDELSVNGYASIDQGILQNHVVLDWMAKYFDLPNVKRLNFERLSSEIRYSGEEGWAFNNIRLRSDDLNLEGYFGVGRDTLVKSELSVFFPRLVLIQSSRLRPLVKRINEEHNEFQFDFKLTGYLDQINVRWSPSDLKTEIVNIIPGFIQRKIENGLESPI